MTTISKLQDSNGFIKIAAMDHRDSLKKYVPADKLSQFKELLAETFTPYSTAILIDPEYGAGAISKAKLANIGVLLSREKSGYTDSEDKRSLELYGEEFNSYHLKLLGADGIKILVYYNANAENFDEKLSTIEKVKVEARLENLPLLIEPIVYPLAGEKMVKAEVIVDAAARLAEFADILKVEFPVDIKNFNSAEPYLQRINALSKPWVILSRGMEFEYFKEACKIAKDCGASGYAVGRGVWQEVSDYKSWGEIENYVKTVAKDRMAELNRIFN